MPALKDLRYSIRVLAQKPGFTLAAVMVLALGIGANSAMFTVINSTLLQPLPYAQPDRLVRLFESNVIGFGPFNVASPANFRDWRIQAASYEQMAAYGGVALNLSGSAGTVPERIIGTQCTYNLFSTLGVQPALGRSFVAGDDRTGAPRVAIISYGLWQRHFGGSTQVLGQIIRLDGKDYTVVGVMPAWVMYPTGKTQVWITLYGNRTAEQMQRRGNHFLSVLARLKPRVTVEQARSELIGIAKRIKRENPNEVTGASANVATLKERTVTNVRTLLLVLFGAVGLVLLIACVNVTNLFLARSIGRRREAAIRVALGATRGRLIRQFLTESITVAIAGGGLGLLLGVVGTRLLVRLATNLPRAEAIHVDGTVLLFTAAVALLMGILSGLAPAFSSSDLSLVSAIHEGGRSMTGGRTSNRIREVLVAGEVALSLVLLIGAGLLIKSFVELRSVDPGFTAPRALTMSFTLPSAQYKTNAQRTAFFETLVAKVKTLPGVAAAGIVTTLPLMGHYMDNVFQVVGRAPLPPGQFMDATLRLADPGYFQAMGIPLKRGRVFAPGERLENARQVVISETMAKRFFPGEDPIGQKIRFDKPEYEIVGIVGDVRNDLASEPEPTVYRELLEGDFPLGSLVVRTSVDPNRLAIPVEKEINSLDRDLPVVDVLTSDELVSESTTSRRFGLTLLFVFAALAVVLAAVGLYGVLSYTMGQRTSELGIRMALGASRRNILGLVLKQGMQPAAIGVVVGLAAAVASTRVMESLLFRVHTRDAAVFAAVTVLLVIIALGACAGPAVRAARVDPAIALRTE